MRSRRLSQAPEKGISDVTSLSPPSIPYSVESSEQPVLQKIHSVIWYNPVCELWLQFAPLWIIYECIQNKKNNYKSAHTFEEKNVRRIPKVSNLILSHHFFEIQKDGKDDKLNL